MYRSFLKRVFDILFALMVLVVSSPILLIIALAIKLDSKGPVIFKQRRLGKGGKEFNIYKFRTMIVNAEAAGVYSDKNDKRITRVGSILRKTSLDELPQALNVLLGDMSIIGFRPPLTYHPWPFEEYTDEQRAMFSVRPGITGWAQVNGRKTVEWHKRIEMNVWYAENVSFMLDLKIFFMTVLKVLRNSDNENIGASVVKTDTAFVPSVTDSAAAEPSVQESEAAKTLAEEDILVETSETEKEALVSETNGG
ncbi:MAG: sugar transferase [Clostridia bacterium]|nr:sugar transferase [Clostridia bacterium]